MKNQASGIKAYCAAMCTISLSAIAPIFRITACCIPAKVFLPVLLAMKSLLGTGCCLHSCEIQDRCLVGMGSIVMDQAVLEEGCFLAAGSLVTARKVLRGGYLYAGSPARVKRELTDEEKAHLAYSATHYVEIFKNHLKQL